MARFLHFLIFINLTPFIISDTDIDEKLKKLYKTKKCEDKCVFQPETLTSLNIAQFPKSCSKVCANLNIDQNSRLSENQLTEAFRNVKNFVGILTVVETNLTSLVFLSGLETMDFPERESLFISGNPQIPELELTNLTSISSNSMEVTLNKKLKTINFPNLKKVTIPESNGRQFKMFWSGNDPNFCVTTKNVEYFMRTNVVNMDGIHGTFCESVFNEKVCREPAEKCEQIVGDVIIGQKFDLKALKSVVIIYGQLIINGTELENFHFLESLEYVVCLENYTPAIIVTNNMNLTDISFPKLKKIHADGFQKIDLTNNSALVSTKPKFCNDLAKSLKLDNDELKVNGNTCGFLLEPSRPLEQDGAEFSRPYLNINVSCTFQTVFDTYIQLFGRNHVHKDSSLTL